MHTRDLDVFKKAYSVALDIHSVTDAFPKHELYGGLADQMRRASRSICANMVEGLEKQASLLEQKRFLSMAMGSAEEMRVWCMFCRDLKYISGEVFAKWDDEYHQINKMLYALIERRISADKKAA